MQARQSTTSKTVWVAACRDLHGATRVPMKISQRCHQALNVLLQGYQDPDLEPLIQNFSEQTIAIIVRHPNIISRLGTALPSTQRHGFHYCSGIRRGGDFQSFGDLESLTLDRALTYLKQVAPAWPTPTRGDPSRHQATKSPAYRDPRDRGIADFGVARLEAGGRYHPRRHKNTRAAGHSPQCKLHSSCDRGEAIAAFDASGRRFILSQKLRTLICGASPRHLLMKQSPVPGPVPRSPGWFFLTGAGTGYANTCRRSLSNRSGLLGRSE